MALLEKLLCMGGGEGATSYAANSRLQEMCFEVAKPVVQQVIVRICSSLNPICLVVADMGCSSGPNVLRGMSNIIHTAGNLDHKPAEIQYYMNDLPGNDFNTLFKLLADRDKEGVDSGILPYYVMGVPGSFYRRLFPRKSVHFFNSTFSLHWLSQIPPGLINENNIYITDDSPPIILDLYHKQFDNDFSCFLRARSEEIVSGGQMMLCFPGRKNKLPVGEYNSFIELLAKALRSMCSQGIISENSLKTLDLPLYGASLEEIKKITEKEGSFTIDDVKVLECNWDPYDDLSDDAKFDNIASGENVSKYIRAAM